MNNNNNNELLENCNNEKQNSGRICQLNISFENYAQCNQSECLLVILLNYVLAFSFWLFFIDILMHDHFNYLFLTTSKSYHSLYVCCWKGILNDKYQNVHQFNCHLRIFNLAQQSSHEGPRDMQSWSFQVFFNLFNNKKLIFFAFIIKLITYFRTSPI